MERARRRLGVSRKFLHQEILQGKVSRGSFLLPAGLTAIAEHAGLEPLILLQQHTPYRYVVAYAAEETAERMKWRLLLPSQETTYKVARTIQTILPITGLRKYCPECAIIDTEQRGESYWRCSIQLPAVTLCVLHRKQLRFYLHQQTNNNHPLPHEVVGEPVPLLAGNELLHELTTMSVSLMSRKPHGDGRAIKYRQLATKAGYVKGGKLLAAAHLTRDLHQFYGDEFLESVQCNYQENHRIGWPSMMLRPSMPLNSFSTLRHLLLEVFLSHHQASETTYAYPAGGKKSMDYSALDRKYVRLLSTTISTVPEKINKTTLLKEVGILGTFKHHRKDLPMTVRVLEELANSPHYDRSKPRKHRTDK